MGDERIVREIYAESPREAMEKVSDESDVGIPVDVELDTIHETKPNVYRVTVATTI